MKRFFVTIAVSMLVIGVAGAEESTIESEVQVEKHRTTSTIVTEDAENQNASQREKVDKESVVKEQRKTSATFDSHSQVSPSVEGQNESAVEMKSSETYRSTVTEEVETKD